MSCVSLGTMHRARGLKFKAVAIVGCDMDSCRCAHVKGGGRVSHRGGVNRRDGGERGARGGETAARPEAKSFGRVELARACVFSELLFFAFGVARAQSCVAR